MPAGSPPIRVLLVDDDDEYATLLHAQLSGLPEPIVLEHVATPSAVRAALDAKFDAIVIDLDPDGFDLDMVDRLQEAAHGVPVIAIATHDTESLGVQAVQRGAQDYVVKNSTDGALLMRSIQYVRERAEWRRLIVERDADLRQAHKMEAVGRLAGGVAHDFNNVLTAIFGYVDLLLDQFTQEDPRRADVQEIRRSAERAAALTRQLLAFSRKQMMQPRVLNLNDVIASLEKLLARLVGEDVRMDFSPCVDLWHVCADPGQIEQVLMNLTANARDAMPEGGRLAISTANVLVKEEDARTRPGLRAGAYATMTVSDTGAGVPDSIRAQIFEPFFTTKEMGKGTGLGLATVYGIIKQTGGGVYVESRNGQGTRFVIYLPRVPRDDANVAGSTSSP
jgi:signal transduction histidine kinase